MSKRSIEPQKTERIRLRLLEEKDLPRTLEWRNQDSIRKWFFSTNILAPEQHFDWFFSYKEKDDDFVFIIESVEDNFLPIGQISLYHINWENHCAEYGRIMIGEPSAKGKGFAKDATQLLLKIGFEVLHLKQIYLEVFKNNTRAISVYLASGFKITQENNDVYTMEIYANS